MLSNDLLCRTASYPKAFKGDIFDVEQFFRFDEQVGCGGTYAISVASKFQLGADEAVHAYGRDVARIQNARYIVANGRDPDPAVCYLAFYEGRFAIVHSIAMEFYRLHVKYRPVVKGDAHFQIEMWPTGAACSRKQRRVDRTDASRAIANKFSGPCRMPHDCYALNELELASRLPNLPAQ